LVDKKGIVQRAKEKKGISIGLDRLDRKMSPRRDGAREKMLKLGKEKKLSLNTFRKRQKADALRRERTDESGI